MNVGEKIKFRRKELGLSADQLAEKLGKDRSTIYRYESKEIEKLPIDIIEPLAKALLVSPQYLMGWTSEKDESYFENNAPVIAQETITFPVIGDIAAGFDKIAVESWEGETVEIPLSYLKGHSKEDYFVLSVKGDSMYPFYLEGDKVLLLRQSTVANSGDIAAVIYDDECATLKKVELAAQDFIKLVPINPLYQPIEIKGEAVAHCRIIGVPRLLIREIEKN